ncbi:Glu-tRNA(Gln) amidotransferase subunit GatD [Acidianus sulfidivorans JP7]|uniref:Glutamyl-tRNA(Gln) amidotransferase subunit D n=1 Tax=Acidianus sulfidivorans JP7 TaxID=619593 RepID=A0A2U9IP88_9CREN|nr:Glu-tRNA(Gln) amidotransferase subunit GatD [Acidianus sulfidivorans]AWR97794.1 Glu-tRNA(Gln) amidotransferase subunit GatD [Acidianus sulfidivorans JP7]
MLEGYRGLALNSLSSINADIGDRIEIVKNGNDTQKIDGILMPSYSNYDDIVVIKLDNGYNIGVSIKNAQLRLLQKRTQKSQNYQEKNVSKSEIKIISTGGTIVSKIEYETGAVRPALSAEEIIEFMPEIKELANISAEILFSILSENMKPEYWTKIIHEVKKAFDEGNKGVIVAHGTDTMAYTASALSFALKLSGPVVLVGSQRSSDRPSSDSAINLYSSVLLARDAPFGEVVVNMHGESSDTFTLAHRGVKVRKMHSSRRDAFQSINDIPLAKVHWKENKIELLRSDYLPKNKETEITNSKFNDNVFLLKYYPGFSADFLDYLINEKKIQGLIIEGTGLGHVSSELVDYFKKATKNGIFVGMTTQCLFGRVNMNVYTTGRLLQQAGVVPLEDMLPEVALVKLMWILGHESDQEKVKSLMLTNIAGEINPRHFIDLFPRWNYV